MKLVVGTNFDDALLEKLKGYPVRYLFGSKTRTLTGHGRASFVLPQVDDERLKEHISVAHSYNVKFLYTMNSANLLGKEYSEKFHEALKKEVDSLVNLGVDGFIVALPFLVHYVKREYPWTEVSISSYARVRNIREFENYVNMGADTVILHEDDNRNFKLLRSLAQFRKKVDIELILNNSCLWGCPYRLTHDQVASLSSSEDGIKDAWFEYPLLFCATDVRNDLANLIRMRWIRPEDLSHYEEIGIDRFKIAGRNKKTDWIVRAVKAYSERKYEGNLLDIVSYPQGRAVPKVMRMVGGPSYYDVLESVYVDNAKFPPQWLNYFETNDCDTRSCEECRYCDAVAMKVITVNGKPLSDVKLEKVVPPIELIPRFAGDGHHK
ncbi:MAG: peptidase U32 [Candidatus Aramenus sulfurataquae]|jgi:collagenase-like PrtC family protease|uniref:Peptidase U32 n=2 Tax=Candidatus Aramenus sulfurataquae TaxID=1326980 RepID=W7KW39_9CREN|nr:MAG: peptidase U32 [Candidatus Aramenus sulfurataquae]MCL7344391.1 U32 family peptidase [Candidatus Aramenus sulfurataquae]